MRFWQKKFFLIFLFLIIFGVGFYIGEKSVVCELCPPQDVDFSLFWKAWRILQEKYVDPTRFDNQKMIYGAISGMVKSLEDPYTVFFDPQDTKTFLEDVSGRFEGVGMEVGIRKGQLQVIAPLEGTPAQKAGLRPGDKIIKINDILTADITIEEAVNLIRGPKGTEVTLTILRDEWNTTRDIKIKRAVIEIPSLDWEYKKDDNIAIIKIHHFSGKAGIEFAKAAKEVLKTPANKIILDLRNNPGGFLEIAQEIAGWFLEKGSVVVIEDFGKKQEQKVYKAEGNSKFLDFPTVVLVNQGTASASEILASALRDNRGIKIIGEKTFGKGSVQELENLEDGSSLKITVANWLTPKKEIISDRGLEPDIIVKMTEEDYNKERDPQLEKALEIIRSFK